MVIGVAGGSRPQILYFKPLILHTFLMFSPATPCHPPLLWSPLRALPGPYKPGPLRPATSIWCPGMFGSWLVSRVVVLSDFPGFTSHYLFDADLGGCETGGRKRSQFATAPDLAAPRSVRYFVRSVAGPPDTEPLGPTPALAAERVA